MPLYKKKNTSVRPSSFKSPLNNTNFFQSLQEDYKELDETYRKEMTFSASLTPKIDSSQHLSQETNTNSDSGVGKSQSSDTNLLDLDRSYQSFIQEHHLDTIRQSTPLGSTPVHKVKVISRTNTLEKLSENSRDIRILSRSKQISIMKSSETKSMELNHAEEKSEQNNSILAKLLSQEKIRDKDLTSEVMNDPAVKSLYINFVKEWANDNGTKSTKKKLKRELTISSHDSDVKIRQKVIKKKPSKSNTTLENEGKLKQRVIKKKPNPFKRTILLENGKKFKKIISNSTIFNDYLSESVTWTKEKFTEKKKKSKTKGSRKEAQPAQMVSEKSDKDEGSLIEKMEWLMSLRDVALYVYCDYCDKLRYLSGCKDPLDLPEKWYCHMNPDPNYNKCTDPDVEVSADVEELLVQNEYNAGSIVWAKIDGYPWWPAMVEDDPDIEDYFWLEGNSNIPTHYHVTFFDKDEVTRAWIATKYLKPYKINANNPIFLCKKFNKYKVRVHEAKQQADAACQMELGDRLKKYSFIYRYKPLKKTLKADKKPNTFIKEDKTYKGNKGIKNSETKRLKKKRLNKTPLKPGEKHTNISKNNSATSPDIHKVADLSKRHNEQKPVGKKSKPTKLVNNLSLTVSELSELVEEVKDIEESLMSQEFGIDKLDESLLY